MICLVLFMFEFTFGLRSLPFEQYTDHSFSTYAKFSEIHKCEYQGERNVSFQKILRMYYMDGPIPSKYDITIYDISMNIQNFDFSVSL